MTSLEESAFLDAMIRLSLHWGEDQGARGVVAIREFKGYPRKFYDKGVCMNTAVVRKDSPRAVNPQIKCSQYVAGVMAWVDLAEKNQMEILFLGPNFMLAEGAVSNIFIVKGKTVLTPGLASGILEGVTRGAVIELAEGQGFDVRESFLTRHDLYNADECFLTNTSAQIMPVVNVDGRIIDNGRPGAVTRQLMKSFDRIIS